MSELKNGDVVQLNGGGYIKIINELGRGGQGIVYKVLMDDNEYALKWYFGRKLKNKTEFINNLEKNIILGAPANNFLWPKKLTNEIDSSFGYVMDLRPKEYTDFSSILNNKATFKNFHVMVESAINIANSFRDLHRRGYSYQDLNDGNFFINIDNGDVLICDNDNVAPDGINTGISGKPGYMAPEIVTGKKNPSIITDYHSLAVVLFKLLIRHDPLMGKAHALRVCITEKVEQELYGTNPIFIFDPNNDSNAPVRGIHKNPILLWPKYPAYVHDIFIRAFCNGINNSNARPNDNEWRKTLINLRGEILTCLNPDCQNDFLVSTLKNNIVECDRCKLKTSLPCYIEANKYRVYLYPGNSLYKCHTERDSDDCKTETGKVVKNKKDPTKWGIKNLSNDKWSIETSNGKKIFNHGEVIPIIKDAKVTFNHVQTQIILKN